MDSKILKNKPLVEAIFELRWELQELSTGIVKDTHYNILVGSLYDKVREEYPFHEELPTATLPDVMSNFVVKHRFRKNQDDWPLIQIGPGVITLNDTEKYIWEDFKEKISKLLETLFEVYPDAKNNLKVNQLLLRYIDAIEFNFEENDIFLFLKDKMKMNIEVYDILFKDTEVSKSTPSFDCKFSFPSSKPEGTMLLRLNRGKRKDIDSLIWETMVQTVGYDTPNNIDKISEWVNDAHILTDDCFFKMIDGELLRRFE